MTNATPQVSVVAPAFNERDCIEAFLEELRGALDRLGRPYEIIPVDDGSTDGTRAILEGLCRCSPILKGIALDHHHGKSAAVAAGMAAARGEIIVLIDSDLQNDPADIGRMLQLMDGQGAADCVVGVRRRRQDTWLRRLSSRLANRVARWVTGVPVTDGGCGFVAGRAQLFRQLALFEGAHRFIATLSRMQGATVAECLVNHRPRYRGTSKYGSGVGRALIALRDAVGVRWMMDRRLSFKFTRLSGGT
jgi:dolichol-phosphate mannosyltransferase